MAVDKKISQLASGAPAQAGDEYVVARSGANYKLTLTNIAASMPPIGATTPNTGSFTSLTNSGNLTFSSTAQRITGDMSNATHANRLSFQSSTTNGPTTPFLLPNGTSQISGIVAANASDPTNCSFGQLRVNGTTSVDIVSSILGTGTYLPMTFATGGSERMRLDTSGNLGIGTASPGGKLDVRDTNCIVYSRGTGGFGAFYATGSGTNASYLFMGNATSGEQGRITCENGGAIAFGNTASATERMRIAASGNVGIGTASPVAKLQSAGTSGSAQFRAGTASNGYFEINAFDSSPVYCVVAGANATAGVFGTQSNIPTIFFSNNTERMRVTAGGLVGIGTTSPNVGLEVASAATENNRSLRVAYDTTYYYEIRNLGAGGNRLRSNNGEMLFNITGTDYARLTTAGEFITGGTTDQGAYNLQCNGTGVWGAGAYVNGSDARLKDNIQSLDSGLDVVKAMRPVTFQYKPEYSKDQNVQPGFIAQELQKAMAGKPYLEGVVQEGTNHLNVAYQNIIPILVKAIQELEAKVAALEAK